jgi:RimJ/RimL family protein N-acetyltransferase
MIVNDSKRKEGHRAILLRADGRGKRARHSGYFRLYVLMFNERAMRVYERAGFERTGIYTRLSTVYGNRDFVEMRCRT